MRETQQCNVCKHYSLYHMPSAQKTICARCMEIERTNAANEGVKNANNP